MPNVDDLKKFLKADMVRDGDYIHFCDAGQIYEKEFKNQDGSPGKKQPVLEMDVMINDTMRKITYSPNKTSVELLKAAWGKDTHAWVGKTGIVNIVQQISFGKLTPILVVKPFTISSQAAISNGAALMPSVGFTQQAEVAMERPSRPSPYPGEPKPKASPTVTFNPDGVQTDPSKIVWND